MGGGAQKTLIEVNISYTNILGILNIPDLVILVEWKTKRLNSNHKLISTQSNLLF